MNNLKACIRSSFIFDRLFLIQKILDIELDPSYVELWQTNIEMEVEFTNISMMREYMIIGYVILCIVH